MAVIPDRMGRVIVLAIPVFVIGFLGQVVGLTGRIAATYQAVAMGLSEMVILVLTSAFSFVPIFLAVGLGRYTDRHGAGPVVLIGSGAMTLGVLLPLIMVERISVLVVAMALLGIGQTLQIAALQGEISGVPHKRQRDRMIGSFMIYQSLGQVAAPLLLSVVNATLPFPLYRSLLGITLGLSLVQLAVSVPVLRHARKPKPSVEAPFPLSGIVGTPGLVWLAMAGGLCVAAQDVIFVYTPAIGESRGISPGEVGIALSVFATTQMLARVFYAGLARRFGRLPLMKLGVIGTGISVMAVSFANTLFLMIVLLAIVGLALGLAVTSAVSLTMELAPSTAKATTLSMRLAVNRIAQFAIPLLAGGAAPMLGAGGVFLSLGLVISTSLGALPSVLSGRGPSTKKKCSER